MLYNDHDQKYNFPISGFNPVHFCFQSQVNEHAKLASKAHLSNDEYVWWKKLLDSGNLVRAPFFRGTLHTVPLSIYKRWIIALDPIIKSSIISAHRKKIKEEGIEEIWNITKELLTEKTMSIDGVFSKISALYLSVPDSALRNIIRSAPHVVTRVGNYSKVDSGKNLELIAGINVSKKNQSEELLGELYSEINFFFVRAFGEKNNKNFNKWVGVRSRVYKNSSSNVKNEGLGVDFDSGLIVLPPFDPFLLVSNKTQRLAMVSEKFYNYIWGRSGIVSGAIFKNGSIIGRLTYRRKDKSIIIKLLLWSSIGLCEIKKLKDDAFDLFSDIADGKSIYFDIEYCLGSAE